MMTATVRAQQMDHCPARLSNALNKLTTGTFSADDWPHAELFSVIIMTRRFATLMILNDRLMLGR